MTLNRINSYTDITRNVRSQELWYSSRKSPLTIILIELRSFWQWLNLLVENQQYKDSNVDSTHFIIVAAPLLMKRRDRIRAKVCDLATTTLDSRWLTLTSCWLTKQSFAHFHLNTTPEQPHSQTTEFLRLLTRSAPKF